MNPTNLITILTELTLIMRKHKRLAKRLRILQQQLYQELYPYTPYQRPKYQVEHNAQGWFVDGVAVSETDARNFMLLNEPVVTGYATDVSA